jgi:alanine-glyoxylate transaminase/serine-glyoxylate transaminase/serine-pyruvate transaminase
VSIPGELNPSPRVLLGPGPSDAHPRVLRAMTTPLLGHLDPQFLTIMDEVQELLRLTSQTRNPLTLTVPGTGMAGMETCLVNLLEPGDRAVVCTAGFFGQRLIEIAGRCGAAVTTLERPWGEVFELNAIRDTLSKVRPKVLCIVHAETSTGVWQPMEGLGELCHEFDTLLVIDTVTSLGCIPVMLDQWGVDAAYSCSQKGLGCPPGLAPVSFSPRAREAIGRRKTKVQSWYLDLTLLERYWGPERMYHHTAPITMTYAVREGLRLVQEEGLAERCQRHACNHGALQAGLKALGIGYLAKRPLPQLNAVLIPQGVDDLAVRKQLLGEFNIEIGGGLGDYKGKVWRIGLMGYNARKAVVLLLLGALERCLQCQGLKVSPGAGVGAANAFYATTAMHCPS